MKILTAIFSSIILALGLSACGYDGHYRYPCQDPVNWEAPECNPPLCEATGTCTADLLGYDPKEGKEEITEEPVQETTSDIIEEESSAPAPENVDNINQMVDEMSEGN
jgi:hypothetical protein